MKEHLISLGKALAFGALIGFFAVFFFVQGVHFATPHTPTPVIKPVPLA